MKLALAHILAAGLVATGAIAVLQAASGKAPEPPHAIARQAPQAPAAERPKAAPPPLAVTTLKISGRVLGPDGKPRPEARLWLAFQGTDWTWSTRVPEIRAAAGPDGRFTFTVSDADTEVSRALRMTSGWPDGFGGMVDDATMTKLKSLNGSEFDTLWLESMISHHQGAIEMARAEITNGKNVDAKGLAQTIVETQQAEIGQMKQMLGG